MNEQNQVKVISYNSRILNPQEQKLSTFERELLGIVHALQIHEFLIIGSPHPIHIFTDHKPFLLCFTKKGNLSPRFYRAQMQLTKFSKLEIIQTHQKKEVLPHQKHDSHPIFADYGTDQFSLRFNDKGNDIIVKPVHSFYFKAVTPFQTKFKTPIKNIISLFINNLSYSTILMLQVMMMNAFTLEFLFLPMTRYTNKKNPFPQ